MNAAMTEMSTIPLQKPRRTTPEGRVRMWCAMREPLIWRSWQHFKSPYEQGHPCYREAVERKHNQRILM